MSEYMALYRKWRPSVFADVVGQEHITKVLCGEILSHSVSHAYLFCGSRGTGKTTCAKILSKAVNCENPQNGDPCGKCAACLAFENSYDIVEMDAASNNGVGDIRNVIDKVGFMPIEMKKRIYIIDEVHMLSTAAFNALLKTLEEPPAHVLFILATTELHKIPATILSRCKRFDFHRISPESMLPRLRFIADSEKIGITDDALRLIAFLATGAMRDALSMLELFVGKTDIDREKAAAALGVVGNAPILKLLEAIAEKDSETALLQLENIYKASKDMGVLCAELGEMLRNLLVVKYASGSVSRILDTDPDVITTLRNCEDSFTKERIIYSLEIIEQTQNKLIRSGLSGRTLTELMLVKLCDPQMSTTQDALLERISALEAKLAGGAYTAPEKQITKQKATAAVPKTPAVTSNDPEQSPPIVENSKDQTTESKAQEVVEQKKENEEAPVQMMAFAELLDILKEQSMIIYSVLSDSYAEICGDVLKIYVNPMAYFMLVNDKEKTETITQAASKLLGMPLSIVFVQTTELKKDSRPDLEGF